MLRRLVIPSDINELGRRLVNHSLSDYDRSLCYILWRFIKVRFHTALKRDFR
jgi:hypothetical protein